MKQLVTGKLTVLFHWISSICLYRYRQTPSVVSRVQYSIPLISLWYSKALIPPPSLPLRLLLTNLQLPIHSNTPLKSLKTADSLLNILK